ncbi:MAG: hypothetical protein RL757_1034 [Bacteroidota bacterium]|jgi:hypothetical protein
MIFGRIILGGGIFLKKFKKIQKKSKKNGIVDFFFIEFL